MNFIETYHLTGILIGLSTFLIIGMFHPLVIKCEYYFGVRCWWAFLLMGLVSLVATLLVQSVFVSSLLGVAGFSFFWSIFEIFEQRKRVKMGWFPKNPNRKSDE